MGPAERKRARVAAIDRTPTRVLVEQTAVVNPRRLGSSAGRLDGDELRAIDDALMLVFGLR